MVRSVLLALFATELTSLSFECLDERDPTVNTCSFHEKYNTPHDLYCQVDIGGPDVEGN